MGWNASDQIGRYEVRGQLGAGGFATVLLAYDPVLDGSVAIKVLADNLSLDPDVRARFIQEARVLRALRSERLVTVYDIGEVPSGQPYLVMELARRGTLGARLDQARTRGLAPAPADIGRVVDGLAAALRVVHTAGVVHRDLKPSNLLLQADGGDSDGSTTLMLADESLMLGDFGMAKVLGADSMQLTMQGGTLGYMAPEQLRPFHPIDQRADLYAATALVFELLTGRVPPRPEAGHLDALDDLLARLDGSPQLISALRHGLAFAPDDRFPSVDAWHHAIRTPLGDLAEARHGRSGPDLAPTPPPASGPWAGDTAAILSVTEPRVLELEPGSSWSPLPPTEGGGPAGDPTRVFAPPADSSAPADGPATRRRRRIRLALLAVALIGAAVVLAVRFWPTDGASIVGPDELTVGDVGAFVADADPGDTVVWNGPGDTSGNDPVFQVKATSAGDLKLSAEVRSPDGPSRVAHITVKVIDDEDDATAIGGPALLTVGQTTTLTASVPAGTTPEWTDWDGNAHSGDELILKPTSAGVLHIELKATGDGREHRARRTVTVVDE